LVNVVHNDLSHATWLDRQAARTPPDLVVANSRFTAMSAAKLYPSTSVEVVYLPVAPPVLSNRATLRDDVRKTLGTHPNTVVVLQASRLEEWKGHEVLLDALARIASAPDWEAWIAGGVQKPVEESYLATLKRRVERAGIGHRVRFLGQRSDVPGLMNAADVYCQPNTGPEPFGLAFVEALHAGLPVVTSGFGGAAEIIDQSCGVLTPPGDVEAVARALGDLIQKPERRAELGAIGPHRAIELCEPQSQLNRLAKSVRQPGYIPKRGHEAFA
jgi:glycosyltransferase involved in cell wall biosynthesis